MSPTINAEWAKGYDWTGWKSQYEGFADYELSDDITITVYAHPTLGIEQTLDDGSSAETLIPMESVGYAYQAAMQIIRGFQARQHGGPPK